MSLEERAADFMRVFPTRKLSKSRLHRIYKKYRVRRKKVKITKVLNNRQRKRIQRYIPDVQKEINYYKERGFRMVYIDEMMVTKSTIPTHEWSNKLENFEIGYSQYAKHAEAVIAAVSS